MSVSLSRPGPEPPKPISPSGLVASQVACLGVGEDVAPAGDALVDLLAPVVEDALRHQPGVGVVPDVEVQVGERLGVRRLRAADRDAVGQVP